MERRFTFKDFALFTVLVSIIVLILLAMYMVDRQWLKLDRMEVTLSEQAGDIRDLRSLVHDLKRQTESGQFASAAPPSGQAAPTGEVPPSFQRAAAARAQSDFAEGDWMVDSFAVGLETITPFVSSDAYASNVQNYVLESLLSRDPDTLEWQGFLAESWTTSEDGLTFTFKLRPGAAFSDGQPLTAHDVAFSFAFIMNQAIAAPRERAYYDKIASVTATSDREVVFVFKEPYYDSLSLAGGLSVIPRHFYEPFLQDPEKFNTSKGLLMGSGPYRLRDPRNWTPDAGFVELERNPRYWGPVLPPYRKIMWRIIENDSARLTTFRNGDIDTYGARPVEYQRLLKDEDLRKKSVNYEYMSPVAGYSYIGWNQVRGGKPTRFADKRVRQAMTYLTDRDRIIKDIFLGYAEPAISPFNPRSKQHDTSLEPQPYDLDKAKALLKDAGYEDRDGDGVLDDKDGKPFSFELIFFQDNEDSKRMVLFLKDLYAHAGVRLEPKPSEWAVMLEKIKKQDFEAITLGWTSGIESDIFQVFHSSQNVAGGDNYVNYSNLELDKLIEEARKTVDESKRMPLWQACERIIYEDQPYTFLMRRKSLSFIDNRYKNIAITKLGLNFGSVPIETYVPKAAQRYQ